MVKLIRLVVINENMLGYILPQEPFHAGILASSVIRGAYHFWQDGPYPLCVSGRDVRPATPADFDTFRVNMQQYCRPEYTFSRN